MSSKPPLPPIIHNNRLDSTEAGSRQCLTGTNGLDTVCSSTGGSVVDLDVVVHESNGYINHSISHVEVNTVNPAQTNDQRLCPSVSIKNPIHVDHHSIRGNVNPAMSPLSSESPATTPNTTPESTLQSQVCCLYFDGNLGYPRERLKTLQATLLAFMMLLSNLVVLAIIHDYVGRAAVPDLVFSLVPEQKWAWRAGDPMVLVLMLLTLLLIVLHKHRWVVWRRWMLMMATMYCLRVCALAVTQLPASFEDNHASCKPALNRTDPYVVVMRVLEQIIIAGLQGNSDGYLCGDLMFSGHTVQFSLCCFMLNRYTPRCFTWFRRIITCVALCGMLFMVISRSHYTVDILVAYWLTTLVFSVYHGYSELSHEQRTQSSAFHRLWAVFVIDYFERHVPSGELPNELNWPLPWPSLFVEKLSDFSNRANRDPNDQTDFEHRKIQHMTVRATSEQNFSAANENKVERSNGNGEGDFEAQGGSNNLSTNRMTARICNGVVSHNDNTVAQ